MTFRRSVVRHQEKRGGSKRCLFGAHGLLRVAAINGTEIYVALKQSLLCFGRSSARATHVFGMLVARKPFPTCRTPCCASLGRLVLLFRLPLFQAPPLPLFQAPPVLFGLSPPSTVTDPLSDVVIILSGPRWGTVTSPAPVTSNEGSRSLG